MNEAKAKYENIDANIKAFEKERGFGKKTGASKKKAAVQRFLDNVPDKAGKGRLIAANEFEHAGMSNEQALKVLNSMGKGAFEIYEEKEPGTMWTMGQPVIKRYIRKVK